LQFNKTGKFSLAKFEKIGTLVLTLFLFTYFEVSNGRLVNFIRQELKVIQPVVGSQGTVKFYFFRRRRGYKLDVVWRKTWRQNDEQARQRHPDNDVFDDPQNHSRDE
jgi:hypothetical protein